MMKLGIGLIKIKKTNGDNKNGESIKVAIFFMHEEEDFYFFPFFSRPFSSIFYLLALV